MANFTRAFFCLLATCLFAAPAAAEVSRTSEFHRALGQAMSHLRTANGYLRTRNGDLAAIELEGLIESWKMVATASSPAPDAYAEDLGFGAAIRSAADAMTMALRQADQGELMAARNILLRIRRDLSLMRRRNGQVMLADCILDLNDAGQPFWLYYRIQPDWNVFKVQYDMITRAGNYLYLLRRCDASAPKAVREDPEFRRLIDGATDSLSRMPQVVQDRNSNLLDRILGQLRSIDRLLHFRFG